MLYEKKKSLIYRVVGLILLITCIVVSIKYWNEWWLEFDIGWLYFFIIADVIIPVLTIGTFLVACKVYYYDGKEIIIYAGWYHYYIKVNGVKTDEHNTLISYTAISLSCSLDDGTDIRQQ